jgi:nucleolar protein 4
VFDKLENEKEVEETDGNAADEQVDKQDNEEDDDDDNSKDEDGVDSEGEDEGSDSEDEGNEDDEEEDDEEQDEDEDEEEDEKDKKKGSVDDVKEGCTIFIRDLAFDAEPKDLSKAFKKFGEISMAVIVKDKNTGMSKGTGFVKFVKPESAAACVAEGTTMILDRRCKIDLAVDRETAHKLTEDEKGLRDKRNMYLANEGLQVKNSNGEEIEMSKEDKEKRKNSQIEKKKKLQNPLFYVSANRLSGYALTHSLTHSLTASLTDLLTHSSA